MECKYNSYACNDRKLSELIDTLWNVNCPAAISIIGTSRELIDTLWNVNEEWGRRMASELRELIDTLWNVNVDSMELQYAIDTRN